MACTGTWTRWTPLKGRLTLCELAARYLQTIQNRARTTVSLKTTIVERLLAEFPAGANVAVSKIKQSDFEAWLAGYKFGSSSHNHYVQVLKGLFAVAVNDQTIANSPAERMDGKKVVKPIRVTPTFEEFKAIVEDVRKQKWNAEAQASADFLEFTWDWSAWVRPRSPTYRSSTSTSPRSRSPFSGTKPKHPSPCPSARRPWMTLVKRLLAKPGLKPTDSLFPVNLAKARTRQRKARPRTPRNRCRPPASAWVTFSDALA